MKIPINFLLYVASLGMLAQAGWLFYQATPNLGAEPLKTYMDRGVTEARDLLTSGSGTGRQERRYPYHLQEWWKQFAEFNCIGELPPPPEEPTGPEVEQPDSETTETPIGDIVELLYVMHDTSSDPEESESMVGLRYKPEANVVVPDEYLPQSAGPGDALAPGRPLPKNGAAPSSALPTFGNQEVIHFVRVGESLWPEYEHITLAGVHEDAESAFFVRERPGDPPDSEPKKEELFKSVLELDQELLAAIAEQRRGQRAQAAQRQQAGESGGSSSWVDVDETKMVNGQYHISRKDQEMFSQNSEQLMRSVNVVPYEPRFGNRSLRGLRVANVDPALASRFGVQQGDVILAINDVPVRTRSQAINEGKKQYERGVRTFRVKIMSAGQIIERVYQAPDK